MFFWFNSNGDEGFFFFFFGFPPILCSNKGLCKASPILVIPLAESVVHGVKKLMRRFVFFLTTIPDQYLLGVIVTK